MTPHRAGLLALLLAAMTLSAISAESRVFVPFKLVDVSAAQGDARAHVVAGRRRLTRKRSLRHIFVAEWFRGRD